MSYPSYDLTIQQQVRRQARWSEKTFGPGKRIKGVCNHIRKELEFCPWCGERADVVSDEETQP